MQAVVRDSQTTLQSCDQVPKPHFESFGNHQQCEPRPAAARPNTMGIYNCRRMEGITVLQFHFVAKGSEGKLIDGVITCNDRAAAIRQVEKERGFPIKIEAITTAAESDPVGETAVLCLGTMSATMQRLLRIVTTPRPWKHQVLLIHDSRVVAASFSVCCRASACECEVLACNNPALGLWFRNTGSSIAIP
jgi:hypothetical protein